MAVRIDTEAFLDSAPPASLEHGRKLLAEDRVDRLEQMGGGVQAVVRDGDHPFQPWVGIVEGEFTSECDCPNVYDDLCRHAVAVALLAFDEKVRWSGSATPPSVAGPGDARFVEAARRLARRQLVTLVVEQAGKDRLFATTLLDQAGLLDSLDDATVTAFRDGVRRAMNVVNSDRWELSDLADAGRQLVAEVEVLTVRPATPELLDLVEEAILAWDGMSGDLHDAHHVRTTDPKEISASLAVAHLRVCEQLHLDPYEFAEHLADLVNRCEYDTVPDVPQAYAHLLGAAGVDTFEQLRRW
jgi:uncharacterized Zn finger protein